MLTVLFWKKAWSYIKAYWYIPFILIVLVALFLVGKGSVAEEILKAANDSRKKMNETNERIEAERLAKKAKEYERYVEAVAEVEKKYQEEKKEIDARTKKRIKKMVKEHGDNPEEMAKKLSEEFGLKLGSVND